MLSWFKRFYRLKPIFCYSKLNAFRKFNGLFPNTTLRMISKELKELEINGIVTRSVYNTIPVTVEYGLTPSGKRLNEVIDKWGLMHRETTIAEIA